MSSVQAARIGRVPVHARRETCVFEQLVLAHSPEPSTPAARAPRVGKEFEATEAYWKLALQNLHRRCAAVADMD
jgi:hypothetical protein